MIETTARRDRRTSTRLDQLFNHTAADRGPSPTRPADEPWPAPRLDDQSLLLDPHPWPLDAPSAEPEHPAEPPDTRARPPLGPPATEATPGSTRGSIPVPPDVGTGVPPADGRPLTIGWSTTGPPGADPWWRRTASRLFERWWPDRADAPSKWRLPVLAAGAVLLGIAVAVGLTLSGTGTTPEVPPALPATSVSEVRATVSAVSPASGGSIVISVVGRVTTPGLVTLPGGARVADALEAAGGATPGIPLGGLNLARRLTDGEQIYVGVPAPPGAEPTGGASGAGQPGAERVDLNSASMAALDTLPGVGPVTAQRILDWRTQHGRFASIDQLREIEGIGPTKFARLKDLVTAG